MTLFNDFSSVPSDGFSSVTSDEGRAADAAKGFSLQQTEVFIETMTKELNLVVSVGKRYKKLTRFSGPNSAGPEEIKRAYEAFETLTSSSLEDFLEHYYTIERFMSRMLKGTQLLGLSDSEENDNIEGLLRASARARVCLLHDSAVQMLQPVVDEIHPDFLAARLKIEVSTWKEMVANTYTYQIQKELDRSPLSNSGGPVLTNEGISSSAGYSLLRKNESPIETDWEEIWQWVNVKDKEFGNFLNVVDSELSRLYEFFTFVDNSLLNLFPKHSSEIEEAPVFDRLKQLHLNVRNELQLRSSMRDHRVEYFKTEIVRQETE